MLEKKKIEELIDTALFYGCDFVELFVENTCSRECQISNGKLIDCSSKKCNGLGFLTYSDLGMAYVSTNDFSEKGLLSAIKELSASCRLRSKHGGRSRDIDNFCKNRIEMSSNSLILDKDITEIASGIITKNSYLVRATYPRITSFVGTENKNSQHVIIANSNGLYAEDIRRRIRLTFDVYASNNNEQHLFSFSCGEIISENLFANIDFEAKSLEAAETAITFLNAQYAPVGEMPVVIDRGFGAVIFHETCGHGLEGTSIINDSSIYCKRLKEQVSSSLITLIDDGTIRNAWGTSAFDDEGSITQRNTLIKNGILQSYILDRYTASILGLESTHSCRRESYRYPPSPRMTNTYIENGCSSKDEIIRSVNYGILVKGVGGGAVNPINGDFEFTSNESYLIEKGRITKPLRSITLAGNSADSLSKIEMVGNNLKLSEGYCGAISGCIPITVGQPTLKLSSLSVGGIL